MNHLLAGREPEAGGEEKELALDTDAGQAAAQAEAPRPGGAVLVQVGAEADSEIDAGGEPPQSDAGSPLEDELDPALLELFREARNEVQESTLASELPDIPIQDLLSELVSLRQRLGIAPPARAEPEEGEDSPEPKPSRSPEATWPPLARCRRYALHGLLLSLTLVMAIASALIGADRLLSGGQNQDATPSATATVHPGVVVRQVHPPQPTPVASPEATPMPTPTRQPAYFIHTVQPGDTLSSIAAAFGISLDHILWINPDVIDDPNLLLVGDKLLIPSVAGMIYYVKPGDVLSAIGRLLPDRGPEDPGPRPRRPQPP